MYCAACGAPSVGTVTVTREVIEEIPVCTSHASSVS